MNIKISTILVAHALLVFAAAPGGAAEGADPTDRCNVVWDSPSANSLGSMPIGNGDIGANVWVEGNGDLLLLVSKTDAWDEVCNLLKIGRIRITLSPSPFATGQPFRQELKLREGMIEITGGSGATAAVARVWIDANRPVIRVECEGKQPFDVTAQLETWRTDTVVEGGKQVVWYHRNEKSVWPQSMKHQGLESLLAAMKDPLLDRTFGAALGGAGLEKKDARTLKSSKPAKSHCISIYPLTEQTATPKAWLEGLNKSILATDAVDLAKARAEHQQWWNDFWNRSWVRISGNEAAEMVTRAYTLQRWVSACAGRGAFPIKFNGSIFTVELDFRLWGGGYWWQNTRLPYWPMLASGDYDMMRPMFNMFFNTLELAKARNRIYYKCDGAFLPETINFWGTWLDGDYGRPRSEKQNPDADSPWIGRIWSSGLELAMMMLDYYDHTQDKKFLKEQVLPWSDSMIQHFDTRFKRDATGKLVIDPTQSIETYQVGVTNDTPSIAGLRAVLPRLLALPADLTEAAARQRWARLLKEVPEIPIAERDGKKFVLPAQKFGGRGNCENPELYTIFPFRLYGVGKPDLDIADKSFSARREEAFHGWQQTAIQAAYLGSGNAARYMLVKNVSTRQKDRRFAAFWGPNYDWTPDQCHGGNILNTAQTMLMQCEGSKILPLPAWPRDWDVDFKLHAPQNTTVEAVVRGGKLQTLKVTPESRKKDVEVSAGGITWSDPISVKTTGGPASVYAQLIAGKVVDAKYAYIPDGYGDFFGGGPQTLGDARGTTFQQYSYGNLSNGSKFDTGDKVFNNVLNDIHIVGTIPDITNLTIGKSYTVQVFTCTGTVGHIPIPGDPTDFRFVTGTFTATATTQPISGNAWGAYLVTEDVSPGPSTAPH